jgi:hypothetical protein
MQETLTMPWGYTVTVRVETQAIAISVLTTVMKHQLYAPVAFNTPEVQWIRILVSELLQRVGEARKSHHQHRELHLGHPIRGLSIY